MMYPVFIPSAPKTTYKECVVVQGKTYCESTQANAKETSIAFIIFIIFSVAVIGAFGWALDPYANNTFIRVVLATLFFLSPFILLAIFG